MPVLPKQPDHFPEQLLEEDYHTQDAEARWWALYTMSRREKDLMRRLHALEIPYCGPLIKRRTQSPGGRSRVSYVPLFAGYVFLLATNEQRQTALTTNCISKCLDVPNSDLLVRDLRHIEQLIASDAPLTPEARLEAGARVRVTSGPLGGMEGVVVQRRGRDHLLVSVKFLQQGASVLLEDFSVIPVD